MSDHPENQGKMHDLVQAYARKRRADAEAAGPSEMPPATRERLQDAVRQQFAKSPAPEPTSESAGGWLSRWLPYLPRLAFGLGLLVVLAVAARLLIRNESPRGTETVQLAKQTAPSPASATAPTPAAEPLAHNRPPDYTPPPPLTMPAPIPPATAPGLAPPGPVSDTTPVPKPSRPALPDVQVQPETAAAASAVRDESTRAQSRLREKNPNALTLNGPTVSPSPNQRPAFAPAPLTEQLATDSLKPAESLTLAPAARGTPAPAFAEATAGRPDAPLARKDRAPLPAATAVDGEAKAKAAPGRVVLANFELIQAGAQLRFIDTDDGSIYEGQLSKSLDQRSNFIAGNESEVVRSKLEAEKATKLAVTPQKNTRPALDRTTVETQPRAWAFRATGTNRTLQERVELDGVLLNAPTSTVSAPVPLVRFSQNAVLSTASTGTSAARFYRTQPAARSISAPQWVETDPSAAPPTNLAAIQRIQGTLRVGSTNLMQIDAYRVGR